jgi:bifunctional non-homologous end joining protein LigD
MIAPMLSKITESLPSGKDFIFEIKLDGQRTIAELNKQRVLLYTRNAQDVTDKYPELHLLSKCIARKSAVLDGEIVALQNGIPSFELLQQRMNLRDMRAVRRAVEEVPVFYYVFDILEYGGKSLLKTPLLERKKILSKVIQPCDAVKILPHFDSRDFVLQKAQDFGYEGVVAKKSNSFYYPGQRTELWLKYKFQQIESFVIGGWVEGGRSLGFGSILIGRYEGKDLIHCGRAGTGFDESKVQFLMRKFEKLVSKNSPFREVPHTRERLHWLKPKLVADVRFKEWTRARIVRAPVFLGLREDVEPIECTIRNLKNQ